jgi:hypothetical protein
MLEREGGSEGGEERRVKCSNGQTSKFCVNVLYRWVEFWVHVLFLSHCIV